jgi:hypothetical protein
LRTKTKASFWIIMVLSTWILLEGISFIGYRAINHSWFSYAKARKALTIEDPTSSPEVAVLGLAELRDGDFVEVLHPYFGFVADPQRNQPWWHVSDFGFILSDKPSPITKRSPGKVVIGVFGGSFTIPVYLSLKSVLNAHATELGREFVVINFGLGGYKQPQQLMVLNYLLALGGEFDLVINLDGFNDVALPAADNLPKKVNPFYPRRWDQRTAHAINPETMRLLGRREITKHERKRWAHVFTKYHLHLSPTLFLLWQAQDRRMARAIHETNRKMETSGATTQSYTMQGPPYEQTDEERLYHDIADVWKRSSIQMKALCEANGAKYYHFLQPNQYVAGSKPMMDEEKKQAINETSPYRSGVVKGYPELIKAGESLVAAGVKFTDLTMIYADHAELLYQDSCCHTNSAGSDIVAKRIYEVIYPR